MKKAVRLWGGIALAAVFSLGFFSWGVTRQVQGMFQALRASLNQQGWQFTVDQAQWMSWGRLELSGLNVRSPAGGKLHLVRAHVIPELSSLWEGRLVTKWNLEEIRMDPGSWGIRKPLAQEILSAGPVTTHGFARLHWGTQGCLVEQFSLDGPLLRLHAEGWVGRQRQAHLVLKGSLSRVVLEGMELLPPAEDSAPWEPFEVALDGGLQAPAIRFQSRFLTLMLNQPLEKNP